MDLVAMNTDSTERKPLRLYGGASFQSAIGTITASWPLAVLTYDQDAIAVDIRYRVIKKTLGGLVNSGSDESIWKSRWTELEKLDLGPRSIVLRSRSGSACRFVMLSRGGLVPLITEATERGTKVDKVASTVHWFARPT